MAGEVILERGDLKVTMFPVNHEPVLPAVGYRFDYRGRSVVISGDTDKSESLIQHAREADILIHEILQQQFIEMFAKRAEAMGDWRLAKGAHDILEYHTTTLEVAEVARDAAVHKLVLSHLVPGPPNRFVRRLFVAGMDKIYSGEIVVGEDGMRFSLAPR